MIKSNFLAIINKALSASEFDIQLTALESPKSVELGDFSTPISFSLAKLYRKSPQQIASDMAGYLNQIENVTCICRVTAVSGFVNFKLNDSYIWQYLTDLNLKAPNFPESKEKILLEFVSANPTGPLHIGHGRWAVIGSVLANILAYTHHDVLTEFYINDAGNQVKAFYDSVTAVKLGQSIPEGGYHGAYIESLARLDKDPLIHMIELQKRTLKQLRVEFDSWFSEKSLVDQVDDTIQTLTKSGHTYRDTDALWFSSSKWGDEKDRVLIKADGQYTYFAVDSVYHNHKIKRGFDRLINIWGADHHGYIPRIQAVIEALNSDQCTARLNVIIGQLVSLKRDGEPVRMSKRTGDMIALDDVIEEIGVDATRFFLVDSRSDSHLEFDLAVAKQQSAENPVYYIQYAHARMCRLIEKWDTSQQPNTDNPSEIQVELEDIEHQLIFNMAQWPDTIWYAATHFQPHLISNYCLKLARLFHAFYEHCPIGSASPSVQAYRLLIVKRLQNVLQCALDVLGVSAPKMM